MGTIYLVRHGQDEDNTQGILNGHRDTALTKKGELQAQKLGKTIATTNATIQSIYVSPLIRARQTAEIIAHEIPTSSVTILDDLIERDFGEMSGRPYSDIVTICSPDILHTEHINYFLKPKMGETFPDVLIRAHRVLNFIKANSQNDNVLIVSHGDIGMMLYAAFYNIRWHEALAHFYFKNCDVVMLSSIMNPYEKSVLLSEENPGKRNTR